MAGLSGAGQARIRVQVTGVAEAQRRLRATADGIQQLKDTNKAAADIAGTAAMGSAPQRTGDLAASMRTSATRSAGVVKFGGRALPYANPIHWGWLTRPNPGRRWRGGPIRPNSWASRAAQATQPLWVRLYTDTVNRLWSRNR